VSAKVNVIGENRTIKRTSALTLVLKQVYSWELYMVSVRKRPVRDFKSLPPAPKAFRRPRRYEHHIEPKIQPLTINNSEWMRYLGGYHQSS
jgi:hypothetical protein